MAIQIEITRKVTIPDYIKIERYRTSPALGPKILFFSGGTALKEMSKRIIDYTHNSIHLITPFDSGGSSAKIRNSFHMISVGDLRNRLMALADQSVKGHPEIYKLFSYRLPTEGDNASLLYRLYEIIQGRDPLIQKVPRQMRRIISNHLRYFVNKMPLDFDLRGANIGNLILTGGALNNGNDIDPVLYIFSRLIEAHGTVKPVTSRYLHLIASLEDGTVLAGQHKITGREVPPIEKPVENIYLSETVTSPRPVPCEADSEVLSLIESADIICYPMGSFYTSIIAALLPSGIGKAIAENPCPKIFIPNSAEDPEQTGMSIADSVETLLDYLKQDESDLQNRDLLHYVLLDNNEMRYNGPIDEERISKTEIRCIRTELITGESAPYIDPRLLIYTLLSIS